MTERPNIRRMQIPESDQREFALNIDKELNVQNWKNIREFAKGLSKKEVWRNLDNNVAESLIAIHTLDPSEPLHGSWPEHVQRGWMDNWKQICRVTNNGEWVHLARVAVLSKTYFPDSPALNDSEMLRIDEELAMLAGSGPTLRAAIHLQALCKILDPTQKIIPLRIDTNEALRVVDDHRKAVRIDTFAELASDLKILGLYSPEITRREWDAMKRRLSTFRSGSQMLLVRVAAELKTLAAKEVKITEKGLELVMHDPRSESRPKPLPLASEI